MNSVSRSLAFLFLSLFCISTYSATPTQRYMYWIDQSFTYTYYTTIFLAQNSTITYETRNSTTGTDPVLYLFNLSDPKSGSWMNDNWKTGSKEAKITQTISVAGNYQILIVNKNTTTGKTDLYRNNVKNKTQVAVAGKRFDVSPRYPDDTVGVDRNFFTCKLTGTAPDTYLWMTDGNVITAYNDNFTNPGGYNWGKSSRIINTVANFFSEKEMIVGAVSSSTTGKCDVYAKLPLVSKEWFDYYLGGLVDPLIRTDFIQTDIDYMSSGRAYNCFAYSGGILDREVTPQWFHLDEPWGYAGIDREAKDAIKGFDNYYMNRTFYVLENCPNGIAPRFPGAPCYSRTTDINQAEIIIWRSEDGISHAQVKKHGDSIPHGYDWESKWSVGPRFLHPRDLLNGPDLTMIAYYKLNGYYHQTGATIQDNVIAKKIEAESFSGSTSGVTKVTNCTPGITRVGNCRNGSWLKFSQVDCLTGIGRLNIKFSKGSAAFGKIKVKVGNPTSGVEAGNVCPIATGGWCNFETSYLLTDPVKLKGVVDLYLVFEGSTATGIADIDYFDLVLDTWTNLVPKP